MSASTNDPTGVRRLVADCWHLLEAHADVCPGFENRDSAIRLKLSLAAVRVAELERVVEAARKLFPQLPDDMLDDMPDHMGWSVTAGDMKALRQALAALDAQKGTP